MTGDKNPEVTYTYPSGKTLECEVLRDISATIYLLCPVGGSFEEAFYAEKERCNLSASTYLDLTHADVR